ncbi:MAG TPA: hypothetical protein VI895_14395 [Bdellovibrionota bacterium]|nr:hypothetical protein [Bdellovibrionota bacterium]
MILNTFRIGLVGASMLIAFTATGRAQNISKPEAWQVECARRLKERALEINEASRRNIDTKKPIARLYFIAMNQFQIVCDGSTLLVDLENVDSPAALVESLAFEIEHRQRRASDKFKVLVVPCPRGEEGCPTNVESVEPDSDEPIERATSFILHVPVTRLENGKVIWVPFLPPLPPAP